ncbi:alpha/beta hydrolase-fold protein [uncultured Psychroserpens sp.]|uniref:alpha/beta hydrolase n=1 Tax=uncultured Psychroserpens sp. TaxID=255436 RepID=UPI00262DDEB1|nr:alpha/beta hydrolase-fold protein [uncultured Psychroserpens sp.]
MKRLIVILCFCIVLVSCANEEKQTQFDSETIIANSTTYDLEPVNDASIYAGKLIRIDSFPSKYITPRPVDIWLPKGYTRTKNYSVLYMHDGQMLFDSTTTWNKQEWKVDEWGSQLIAEGKTNDFIVVAIHNIPNIRWQDLFPQKALNFIDENVKDSLVDIAGKTDIKFNGDNYLKFIVEELKPLIDRQYTVYPNKENTFVMGSSMGGLTSMYAISEYPEIFGGAGCLSTHWIGAMPMPYNPYPDAIFKYMEANLPKADTHKLYFDYGNKTLDKHYPKYASRVDEILKGKGYTNIDSKNLFFEGADHSENSWNQRLDIPLIFLLDKNK